MSYLFEQDTSVLVTALTNDEYVSAMEVLDNATAIMNNDIDNAVRQIDDGERAIASMESIDAILSTRSLLSAVEAEAMNISFESILTSIGVPASSYLISMEDDGDAEGDDADEDDTGKKYSFKNLGAKLKGVGGQISDKVKAIIDTLIATAKRLYSQLRIKGLQIHNAAKGLLAKLNADGFEFGELIESKKMFKSVKNIRLFKDESGARSSASEAITSAVNASQKFASAGKALMSSDKAVKDNAALNTYVSDAGLDTDGLVHKNKSGGAVYSLTFSTDTDTSPIAKYELLPTHDDDAEMEVLSLDEIKSTLRDIDSAIVRGDAQKEQKDLADAGKKAMKAVKKADKDSAKIFVTYTKVVTMHSGKSYNNLIDVLSASYKLCHASVTAYKKKAKAES